MKYLKTNDFRHQEIKHLKKKIKELNQPYNSISTLKPQLQKQKHRVINFKIIKNNHLTSQSSGKTENYYEITKENNKEEEELGVTKWGDTC